MRPMKRVLAVDDHLAILGMLRTVIEGLPGFQLAGTATGGEEALERARACRPDVVVLDIALGGEDSGLALIPRLQEAWPAARIVVFSGVLKPAAIRRALAAGAHGLVAKNSPLEELEAALTAASRGEAYFS